MRELEKKKWICLRGEFDRETRTIPIQGSEWNEKERRESNGEMLGVIIDLPSGTEEDLEFSSSEK